ncbi:MAG: DUF423 domain-containing protein [Pseudomonas sp.]
MFDRRSDKSSLLACIGGLLAATAIGLSAYAAHGVADPQVQSRLQSAALYAFGHGVALAALGAMAKRALDKLALALLLAGTLLFSGSLVGGALWQLSTRLAPIGGVAMMAGWVLFAFSALRRR